MSDTTFTETQETEPTATEGQEVDLTAEVEKWKALARKSEARAKENSAAAKRLAEIEEAGRTESEKAADRVAKAEAEVAAVPSRVADALRDALVALGVVSEDRKVLLTATEPEALLAQVRAVQSLESDRKKQGNHVPTEGNPSRSTGNDEIREFTRDLFNRAKAD